MMTQPFRGSDSAVHGPGFGVIRAQEADLDTLAQLIADAFHDLPPSRWLIPAPAARREILPGYFRLLLDHAMTRGVVHTTPGWDAVALWLPAGHGTQDQADHDARSAAVTSPWTSRFRTFDTALAQHHPGGTPHRHLAILAVRPHRQGLGIGTVLLRAYHHRLDNDVRLPAYLEAADRRTRRLYLRHGYTDHGQPIHLPDGPDMYPMWREPLARRSRQPGQARPGQRAFASSPGDRGGS